MSFSIKIQELEDRNLTSKEFYRVLTSLMKHEVYYLRLLHVSDAINDIEAYPLQIAERIVTSLDTLYTVIESCHDYVSANALVRNLADSVSAFVLIYKKSSGEERILRHYLYIMDGLKTRISQLPDDIQKKDNISEADFNALRAQIIAAKTNFTDTFEFCQNEIKKLQLYQDNQQWCETWAIKSCKWRFQEVGKKTDYSWKSIYDVLELESKEFFSGLSEYVHGLSTSNLCVEKDENTFVAPYSIATCLIGKFREAIETIFASDMTVVKQNMVSVIRDPNVLPYLLTICGLANDKGKV